MEKVNKSAYVYVHVGLGEDAQYVQKDLCHVMISSYIILEMLESLSNPREATREREKEREREREEGKQREGRKVRQ